MVDFYDFKFMSMHPLVDHHGPDSPAAIEARSLLCEFYYLTHQPFYGLFYFAHTRDEIVLGTTNVNTYLCEYFP